MPRKKCPAGYRWNKKKKVCESTSGYEDYKCPTGYVMERGKCIPNPMVKIKVKKPIQALPISPTAWTTGRTLQEGTIIEFDERDLFKGKKFIDVDLSGKGYEIDRDDLLSRKVEWISLR